MHLLLPTRVRSLNRRTHNFLERSIFMTKIVNEDNLNGAAQCLKDGGLVVIPTETVYGLGADISNDNAIDNIYKAKGRPSDNPLIVHIADFDDLKNIAREIPENAKRLIEKYWPGPLTVILKKQPHISDKVTAGLDTVAIRMPSHPVANKLIKMSGVYVAAPSANLSGSPSPTTLKHVTDDMTGRVDYIVDGSNSEIGLESTIIDLSGDVAAVLRPGAITLEMIKTVIPDAKFGQAHIDDTIAPKCPGMKYTHYSPKADVIVVEGEKEAVRDYINKKLTENPNAGVLTYKGGEYKASKAVIDAGGNMTEYAKNLFGALREFDEYGVSTVYAEFKCEAGIGEAVKNRIYKSAGFNVIKL